jgi:type II secretory pathway pseudopilin PulG
MNTKQKIGLALLGILALGALYQFVIAPFLKRQAQIKNDAEFLAQNQQKQYDLRNTTTSIVDLLDVAQQNDSDAMKALQDVKFYTR